MGFQPHDFDKEWEGLEPTQPQPAGGGRRWILGLVLVVIGVCIVGAVLIVRQFLARTAVATPPVIVPTSPVQEEVSTEESGLELAPTVTTPSDDFVQMTPSRGDVEAARTGEALTIDGDLSDWPQVDVVPSAFRVYAAQSWNGTADLNAIWHIAWDNDYLYLGVEVMDDLHVQTEEGNQIFRGDSVDVQLDTNRDADYGPQLSPDDFQVNLSPGNFSDLPPSAFMFRGTSDNQILDAPGQHHILVDAQSSGEGYVLEAAIPWLDLETVPSTDLVMGVALNANDNDVPGTAVQEVMMSHVSTRTLRDPTGWGTLTLK